MTYAKGTLGHQLLALAKPEHYQRGARDMRYYAKRAAESPTGKYRGHTAAFAIHCAEHAEAIADGRIPKGTPLPSHPDQP